MPLDFVNKKRKELREETRRIYVCECGDICVETRNTRQTFSPPEFIGILRKLVIKNNLNGMNKNIISSNFCKMLLILTCFSFFAACAANQEAQRTDGSLKIISVGGAVTETIYALDAKNLLIGTDTSSIYPVEATKLPQVGYQRLLSAEGVLSLKPDLILAVPEAGPPAVLAQIESAGVQLVKVSGENTIDGAKTKIKEIAEALNFQEKGEDLIKKLEADLEKSKQCTQNLKAKPRVLFIYSRGSGAPQVGGMKNASDEMIKLAGGENAVKDFEGFKPLTPEALVAIQPDVILLPTRGLQSLGGIEAVLKLPGIADTPAGKNRRIIDIDDLLLLSFSPRVGEGILQLCEKLK